jgi:hypothetical protein
MSWDLDIRPEPEQFNETVIWVVDRLGEGDAIDVQTEVMPPWIHIVAADGQAIAVEMQRRGIAVAPHVE